MGIKNLWAQGALTLTMFAPKKKIQDSIELKEVSLDSELSMDSSDETSDKELKNLLKHNTLPNYDCPQI